MDAGILSLPYKAHERIFLNLDLDDLFSVARTCPDLRKCVMSDLFQKSMLNRMNFTQSSYSEKMWHLIQTNTCDEMPIYVEKLMNIRSNGRPAISLKVINIFLKWFNARDTLNLWTYCSGEEIPIEHVQNYEELKALVCIFEEKIRDLSDKRRCLKPPFSHAGPLYNSVPNAVCGLNNLQSLKFTQQRIRKLPDDLGNLKNLREMDFWGNLIRSIPNSVINLENLETLTFSANFLTCIPEDIGKLKKLRFLNLDRNRLIALPDSLADLENLESLCIDNNPLKKVPDLTKKLPNLKNFWISNDQKPLFSDFLEELEKRNPNRTDIHIS